MDVVWVEMPRIKWPALYKAHKVRTPAGHGPHCHSGQHTTPGITALRVSTQPPYKAIFTTLTLKYTMYNVNVTNANAGTVLLHLISLFRVNLIL